MKRALLIAACVATRALADEATWRTWNSECAALQKAGRYSDALEACEHALDLARDSFPADHSYLAIALNNAAEVERALACYVEATALYEEARTILEKAGPSEALARLLGNLGELLRAQERLADAEPYYVRALLLLDELAIHNEGRAIVMVNQGHLHKALGRLEEAESGYRRALDLEVRVLPRGHPSVASTMSYLANLALDRGELDESVSLFSQLLEVQLRAQHGRAHPELGAAYRNLAKAYRARGSIKDAIHYQHHAAAVLEQVFGKEHVRVAGELESLGELYIQAAQYKDAQEVLERALTVFDRDNPRGMNVATTAMRLAEAFFEGNRLKEAELLANRAIGLFARMMPEAWGDAITAKSILATALFSQGRTEESLRITMSIIDELEQKPDVQREVLTTSYDNAAAALAKLGRVEESRAMILRRNRVLGEGFPKS